MPLQATSGAASYDAFGGGVAAVPNYIEECFSTFLYTGTGATQTITNGIDLSTKGGLVWIKGRSGTTGHRLTDTARGVTKSLASNATTAEATESTGLTAFGTTGFTIGADADYNTSAATYTSWTFRKQPKFFDVVTYTGDAVQGRQIAHSLGSTPGCIFVKCTSTTSNWTVYHRSLTTNYILQLNSTTNAINVGSPNAYVSAPTDTTFTVGNDSDVNASGATYVAYLFAHDAGGFGLTGTDNVISCGSFTTDGSGNATVSLGYEPQLVLMKASSATSNWFMVDNMRGMTVDNNAINLFSNTSGAETSTGAMNAQPLSTGFKCTSGTASSTTYIYIAIRRGPMRTPTTGTSVFAPITYTGTNVDNRLVNTGIVTDMTMARIRTATSTGGFYTADRLRGNASLGTAIGDAENTDADSFMTPTVGYGNSFSAMNGFGVGNDATRQLNQSSTQQLAHAFKRAPGYFDVVCWTGTGSARTVSHNLTVAPELLFVKARSNAQNWSALCTLNSGLQGRLNTTDALSAPSAAVWGSGGVYVAPTSSVFTVGTDNETNASTWTYCAYLFSTCAGVSKVGSYTGNGTSQTINCGFTAGARFVLMKRTDAIGNWAVWDTARGMVAGNDPFFFVNTTSAEFTSYDDVDTDPTGFIVNFAAGADMNASGGTYIFLAIA